MKHENSGKCGRCLILFDLYPNFHPSLRNWFNNTIQKKHPEAHISEAGRGRIGQEVARLEQKSKAHFGESPHNYNMAIDVFRLLGSEADYDETWFKEVIEKNLLPHFLWYGNEGPFRELPHIEMRDWKKLRDFYPLIEK